MSRERMTGRILNVWEEPQGTTLTADAAAGTTVLAVDDVSPFNAAGNDDGSGGWLQVGDQVVQYVDVDDDASTITLAGGLPTAVTVGSETGDVLVWNDLYSEVDTVQWVLVKPGGSRNQADPIQAVVSDTIVGLPNGDRGGPGETCELARDGDEWELTRVKGRPSSSKGTLFEDQDTFTATAGGDQTFALSHLPIPGSVHLSIAGCPQTHNDFTIDYNKALVTVPDSLSLFAAGDVFDFRYAYRSALPTSVAGVVLELDPLFYYRYDDDPTSTTLEDSTGKNNYAIGGPFPGISPGFTADGSKALYFDGAGTTGLPDPKGGGVNATENFTFMTILQAETPPDGSHGSIAAATWSLLSSFDWDLWVDPTGAIIFDVYPKYHPPEEGGAHLQVKSGGGFLDGKPHLIIATMQKTVPPAVSGFSIWLSIDGGEGMDHGTVDNGWNSSAYVTIGHNHNGHFYKGFLDETAYWDRTLTGVEKTLLVRAWNEGKVGIT